MNVYVLCTIGADFGYAIVVAETTQQAITFLDDYLSEKGYYSMKWELYQIIYELQPVENKEQVIFYDITIT